ncbi:hypothetical protein OKW76_07010 [Sphingomonas sp. S1-29]|uniref:hypothetical protein n=1 Tax=Sphingomonas sp. S1-29 TaxID=2991074 RepID=UPI00223FF74F|nr:hypothetical protein [Sphingomonas sp. S1-29]UZK70764.1 hypothetical protein OKW76_07010 [Sphingomonas sp. S1-29]
MSATTLTVRQQLVYEKELCERSFKDFIRLAWPHVDTAEYKHNWHVDVLAEHLQACTDGRITRLLINICPGSAKSLIVNVLFPAWLWAIRPKTRVLSASHSFDLATRDSLKTRRLITSEWFQRRWPIGLRNDQDAKTKFENDSFGAREATPLKSITGNRANFVIIDDPHSVDDAKSAAMRATAVETYLTAVPSRLNDPDRDVIICVMQRLHEGDVSGAILGRPDLDYDHLCIPLFADGVDRPPTSIGWIDPREEGENMFPARYTEKVVRGYRASLGPLQFSGQYQQAPAPDADGFFRREWFHRYEPSALPQHVNYYMTSDHAPSGNNDYNVFRIWAVDHNRALWLVDSFRKRCTMDIALGLSRDANAKTVIAPEGAFALIRKYKPRAWFPENDGTWAAIKSMVSAAMIETKTFVTIDPLPTKGSGDKVGKAVGYQAMAAMGQVHLPVGPIGDEALSEYAMFPAGKRDDQVDADSAIARALEDVIPAWLPIIAPKKKRSMFDDDDSRATSDDCWG